MTVQELIDILSEMPRDSIVLVCDDGCGEYGEEIIAYGKDEGQLVFLHIEQKGEDEDFSHAD